MPESRNKLRVAMFPWLAFGHIIPFLELAKKIAQKGHTVYFISTLGNIKRLPKIPPSSSTSINIVQLSLPQVENLPQNAEATMDVPYHKIPLLKKAYDKLQEPLSHFLESQVPDWIIYGFAPHWLPPIASKLGISCAYFSILNASSMSFIGPTDTQVSDAYGVRTEPEDFTVPPKWVPSSFSKQVRFRLFEAKKIVDNIRENDSGVSDRVRAKSSTEGCHVYLIRSCEEVESEWLNLLPELHRKPVVPVGLLPPSVQDGGDEEKDGAWNTVNQWLSNHEKGSVVYVALGSEIRPSQEDFNELALGLELSGLPFFWALRRSNGVEGGVQVKLPDGFEERTKGRGVVWTSWAPQLKVLAHESVGGFLTHCGWGSTIEGLLFGRPLIMLPYLTDQGLNARFYDKEVGVEVPRNENDGSFTRDSVAESLRLVVVEEEGKSYREKAKKMSEIFGDEDLHDRYVEKCIKYLEIKRRI